MIRVMCAMRRKKLFVTHFEGVMPPTLITSSEKDIRDFFERHSRDIVVKPLFAMAGRACSAFARRLKTSPRWWSCFSNSAAIP
jgi:glutathione synthase/RimK-type ligase-like ATP-grasp enzyme